MDSDKSAINIFGMSISDVLASGSYDKELQALFKLGKHYASTDVSNFKIDAAGFDALEKVAAKAYKMATKSYDDEEDKNDGC